jgi:solute:Na+ symporter, SSS family
LRLTPVDWAVISGYFLFNLAIGFYYRSRAGRSTNEFFLSGRNAPWWLAGTSMVATTFAADTSLCRHGHGGAQRHRGELALVERGAERHAPSPYAS